ncbi:hypothetical protein HGA34_00695 [Candidatus Falkowbacteria bacterium]|nr:hypothetical protein [Candidatus Falkowbacteria bacterium]
MRNKEVIITEAFYALTGALAVFTALELAWPGVVLAYININAVLLFWLVFGILKLRKGSEKGL